MYFSMPIYIFVKLAVKDLNKSMDFYQALGFNNNPNFSDENSKCMIWSENIFLMIMTHEKFKTFTQKPIADTKKNIAALFAISVGSIDEVDTILENGLKNGGTETTTVSENTLMHLRRIEDF